jgi:hypothetical protein
MRHNVVITILSQAYKVIKEMKIDENRSSQK